MNCRVLRGCGSCEYELLQKVPCEHEREQEHVFQAMTLSVQCIAGMAGLKQSTLGIIRNMSRIAIWFERNALLGSYNDFFVKL